MQRFLADANWKDPLGLGTRPVRFVPQVILLILLVGLIVSGCTSDDPNDLGTPLVPTHIDEVLVPLQITQLDQFMGKAINDLRVPIRRQEALYLGSQGGTSSSMLVNYDFSDIFTDSIPEEAYTQENIVSVNFRFLMLDYYVKRDTLAEGEKYHEVFQLEAPFDTTAYPGPVPPYDPTDLNIDAEPEEGNTLTIGLPESFFLSWVANDTLQGLMVREGSGSRPGLVGFSSRDMKHGGTTLPPVHENTVPGPALLVKFVNPDTTLVIRPVADTSTFDEILLPPIEPDDGFFMRTCLRNYPILSFDFSALPENVRINRAVLYVVNDTISSFGNLESIVVSEFDLDWIGSPHDTLPLEDLEDVVYSISGMVSLDPTLNRVLQFNVTDAIQRVINGVYDGQRGLILTAGEDFFPSFDLSVVDPDLYFTQFNFFGTAAADSLRPQLRISYSAIDELTGGGE